MMPFPASRERRLALRARLCFAAGLPLAAARRGVARRGAPLPIAPMRPRAPADAVRSLKRAEQRLPTMAMTPALPFSVTAKKALPIGRRSALAVASFQKFWVSLNVSRGDLLISFAFLILPGLILRLLFRIYVFLLSQLDRQTPKPLKLYRPKTYKASMFYAIEHAGLLQLGGGLSLITIALRVLFAAGKRVHISDPVTAKGGTPLRFQRFATVVFWGIAIAKVKKRLLLRGDVGGFRTPRQRFVIDRVSDVAIGVLVALACFDAIGLPIGSLAAAGGVGGLVLGLASKEVVENLFGGVALLFTSPFSPGDVVTTPKFSGRISNIGFYTTSVINFDGCVTIIPNSLLTNQIITNLTRASRRRFSSRYMLRYSDMPAVPGIAKRVRESIKALPLTDKGSFVRSHLTSFGPYALVLEAQCLVTTNSRDIFLDFQQDALLCISKAVEEAGAKFATEFPLGDTKNELPGNPNIEGSEGD